MDEKSSRHTPCADAAQRNVRRRIADIQVRPCWPRPPSCTPATRKTAGCGRSSCRYCEDEIERIYRRLGVTFDHTLGESFYEDRLAAVVEELLRRGHRPRKRRGRLHLPRRPRRRR